MRGRRRGLGHDRVLVAGRHHERRVVASGVAREAEDRAVVVPAREDVAEVGDHVLLELADRDRAGVVLGHHELVLREHLDVTVHGTPVPVARVQLVDDAVVVRRVADVHVELQPRQAEANAVNRQQDLLLSVLVAVVPDDDEHLFLEEHELHLQLLVLLCFFLISSACRAIRRILVYENRLILAKFLNLSMRL